MELLEDKQKLSALWQTQNPTQKIFDYLGLKLAFLSCKVFSPVKGCICAFFDCNAENTTAFPVAIAPEHTDYISVMPTNLYGPNDNYHPTHSHVLPALIRRFHEAKEQHLPTVTCWGDGSPLREFLYVDDLADLCVFLMNHYSGNETVNAGTGKELSIRELTELVAKVIGYEGEILWDTSKPNGTPRKLLDVSKSAALGWTYKTELEDGIRLSYEDFLNNPMRAER